MANKDLKSLTFPGLSDTYVIPVTGVKGSEEADYRTGNVSISKGDIGLGNVDNTSDANKPVSTATQTALDGKVPTSRTINGEALSSDVTLDAGDIAYDDTETYASGSTGEALTQLKSAFDDVADLVGDTSTDLGTHTEKVITDLTDMTPKTVTDSGVSYVITRTHVSATTNGGTSTESKLRTLQDNISALAGDYEFSIGTPITSSGYQLQLFNATTNSVIKSFSSLNSNSEYTFSLSSSCSLQIRLYAQSGSTINDSNEIYLHKITDETVDNTLAYVAKKSIDFAGDMESELGKIEVLNGNKFPICTFVDDDTTTVDAVTAYINACDNAGIKGTLATLTNKWENNTTLRDLLKTAERGGHNVILHAYSQDINDCWSQAHFDIDECTENLVRGMQMMGEAGFSNYNYWATPDNTDNEALQTLARRVGMKCKLIGNNWANDGTHQISRYRIYRCALNVDDTGSLTLAQLKAIADDCYNRNGWLVIMTHFHNENQSGDYAVRLQEMVTYLTGLGYKIANLLETWSYRQYLYDLHDMF